MRGSIEQVWQNESRKGRKYRTIQIGRERYGVREEKCFGALQEGVTIDFEVKESGDFGHPTASSR